MQFDALAHGLTRDGRIVVALPTSDPDPQPDPERACTMDVRLDVVKEAPEFLARILAASLHTLGTITWLPRTEVARLMDQRQLPLRVAGLAGTTDARVGILETDRILLHDAAGVTPLLPTEVVGCDLPTPVSLDPINELIAVESISALPGNVWQDVLEAVARGRMPGRLLARREAPPVCGHLDGQVFCVDVDATGIVLMRVSSVETLTAFVELDGPICGPGDLARAVSRLRTARSVVG